MNMIYEKFGFIVGFFVFCVLFQAVLGTSALNDMLLIVLLSMVFLNADAFTKLLKGE